MKKPILILSFFLCTLAFSQTISMDEEQTFFKSIKENETSLSPAKVKNFTLLLSSAKMEHFAEETWQNKEVFPLQFIWLNSGKYFITERGVPLTQDSVKTEYKYVLNELKSSVTQWLPELEMFMFKGVFQSISEDYRIAKLGKNYEVKYEKSSASEEMLYTALFSQTGQCLKISVLNRKQQSIKEVYPQYKISKLQQVLAGWITIKTEKFQYISRAEYILKTKRVSGSWFPDEIAFKITDNDEHERKGKVIFRNVLVNQPIQYLQQ